METEFAHPVERELARVFDEHGIAWEYEPHTFVLETYPNGAVREAFTPDFYLPELDMYIECTVLRQPLTYRKRRKARRARKRAGVTVEILYKHDCERPRRPLGAAAARPRRRVPGRLVSASSAASPCPASA